MKVQLEEYTTRVAEVRSTDIAAFREIEAIVNPPPTVTPDTQRQGQSNQQGPVIFKPQADLKPCLLQRDCNLKEVENFIQSFRNYTQSGYMGAIPNGAVYSQALVNVYEHWLT